MPRTVKTAKDKDDNDIEVYADTCSMCSREMIFPKDEADRIEAMFPFIKDKVESGSPCVECMSKKENNYKVFSDQEIQFIKNKLLNQE